jgi:hypothetical protein
MDFSDALKELKNGNRIAREAWPSECFIYMPNPHVQTRTATVEHVYTLGYIDPIMTFYSIDPELPRIVDQRRDYAEFSQEGILAEDWYIYG